MYHDPDFMPFQPPIGRSGPFDYVRNYIETFSASTYVGGMCFVKGTWPFKDTLFVTEPSVIEDVLIKRPELLGRDLATIQAMSNFLDERGLFLAEGMDWRWQRRAVAPAFRYENLLRFVPRFFASAIAQAQAWRNAGTAEPVDVAKAMTQTTFDVIVRTLLGGDGVLEREKWLAAFTASFNAFPWQSLLASAGLPKAFPHPGSLKMRKAVVYLRSETNKIVIARRSSATHHNDVLDLLIAARDPETGRALNDEELTGNLFTFVAAGHETAAMALAWVFWLLAKDQTSQERVRDEVIRVAGACDIYAEQVERLTFTRQVIQEAMRLFPPAPAISRQAREDTMLGTHTISKKAQIVIPIWSLHRNERLWDDPSGFGPDRFSPDEVKARHRFSYLPFGGGARICVGMSFAMLEIITILATLIREFRFHPTPGFKPQLLASVSLRSKKGLPLRVEPLG
jgi:cytochrome P450